MKIGVFLKFQKGHLLVHHQALLLFPRYAVSNELRARNKGIQTIDLTNPTSEMYKELQAFAGELIPMATMFWARQP